MIVLDKS